MSPRVPTPRALLALPIALAIAACSGGTASPSATGSAPSSPPAESPSQAPSEQPTGSAGGETGTVEIVGVEYAFENVPATTEVGTTFSFRNEGDEVHEMVVVRKNEGVEQSFEELLQLPDEEALDFVTIVEPVPFADPGEESEDTVTLDEAGEYILLCFVPVGTTEIPEGTPDPSALPEGPPHFTEGMLAEFTVE